MNNEELLALYLDGSLTEAERTDFERLLQTSPAFAQEAREFLTIQDMLVASEDDDERTAAFLRKIEDNIANAVIAAGAVATVGTIGAAAVKSTASAVGTSLGTSIGAGASVGTSAGTAVGTTIGTGIAAGTAAKVGASAGAATWASSLISTIFASTTSMVVSAGIGVATIVGGMATVNYVAKRNTATQTQTQQAPATQERSALPTETAPKSVPDNTTANNTTAENINANTINADNRSLSEAASTASNTPSAAQEASSKAGTQTASGVSAAPAGSENGLSGAKAREYSARISGGNAKARYAAAVSDYTKQLQAKEAAGDRTGAAFVEKSLGVLLRQNGQGRESRLHLANAAKAAHSLGLQELEGETLAELALLDAAEGKKERAVQGLQAAVNILNVAKSNAAERWQKELAKLSGR